MSLLSLQISQVDDHPLRVFGAALQIFVDGGERLAGRLEYQELLDLGRQTPLPIHHTIQVAAFEFVSVALPNSCVIRSLSCKNLTEKGNGFHRKMISQNRHVLIVLKAVSCDVDWQVR